MLNVIYLMGTGRSGTTALATILDNSEDINTVGEINQFYNKILEKSQSSYYWSQVDKEMKIEGDYSEHDKFIYKSEQHFKSILYLCNIWPKNKKRYNDLQISLLRGINQVNSNDIILDSSKYVSRALLLNQIPKVNLKIINIVRDPRGVIWSFKKKVQTSNSPMKTVIYYWFISLICLLTKYKFKQSNPILTIRYEDLITNSKHVLRMLSKHIQVDLKSIENDIEKGRPFKVPDIIGGNRLKNKKEIVIKADLSWMASMSKFEKYFYYFLTFPLNLIHGYKL